MACLCQQDGVFEGRDWDNGYMNVHILKFIELYTKKSQYYSSLIGIEENQCAESVHSERLNIQTDNGQIDHLTLMIANEICY